MMDLIIGIAIGAAFAPFWMKVYSICKSYVQKMMNKPGA